MVPLSYKYLAYGNEFVSPSETIPTKMVISLLLRRLRRQYKNCYLIARTNCYNQLYIYIVFMLIKDEFISYFSTKTLQYSGGKHTPVISWSGVSCSGKDYLLEKLTESLSPDEKKRVRILNQGTLLSEQLNVPRDLIRTSVNYSAFQKARINDLPKIRNNNFLTFLNAHVVVKHQGKYVVTRKFEVSLNPLHYIVVVSDPLIIAKRRLERNSQRQRKSDIEPINVIDWHQRKAVRVIASLSERMKTGMSIIYNSPELTQENINFLQQVLTIEMRKIR